MPSVLWSGRPPDAKLLELLRGRGVRVADASASDAVVEVLATSPRAVPADGRPNGRPWIWFAIDDASRGSMAP